MTTLPTNQVFINADPSLLKRLYTEATKNQTTPPTTVQIGIAVIFGQDSAGGNWPPSSADIYTNSLGELLDSQGKVIDYLSFSPALPSYISGGKAYIALSAKNDWSKVNPFTDN
jgi:hypothetical protein